MGGAIASYHPAAIHMDGAEVAVPDTEKITINLGPVDLGRIDLLVQQGVYSNRTDLIRTAVRNQLDRHAPVVDEAIVRTAYTVGVYALSRAEL